MVRAVLDESGIPEFADLAVVEAHPELKTALPGGRRASQTDLWLLAANDRGRVSIGVEGKVDETFGPLVEEWGPDGTPGRVERLRYLTDLLGLPIDDSLDLRYQLLHRTAATIIEAERTGCSTALMLVHSFDPGHAGFEDYSRFVERLGGSAVKGGITSVGTHRYVGWVADGPSPIAE